jgi:hypothetical protein
MKDGRRLAAADYWGADGLLHYRLSDAGESTLDMNDLDLRRMVDENAERHVPFTLEPQPLRGRSGGGMHPDQTGTSNLARVRGLTSRKSCSRAIGFSQWRTRS